jgi:hypothetical protein
MKKILTMLFVLIGFSAFSQTGFSTSNAKKLLGRDTSNSIKSIATRYWATITFATIGTYVAKADSNVNKGYYPYYGGTVALATKVAKSDSTANKGYYPYYGGTVALAAKVAKTDSSVDKGYAAYHWAVDQLATKISSNPTFTDTLVVLMNGDSVNTSHNGTAAYLRWTGEDMNLRSTGTNTNVIVGPVGGGGTGTVTIRDGSGAYLTTLTQNDATLNIQALTSAHNVVVNDDGLHSDFRIESDNNTDMLTVNGSGDKVGIGKDPSLATLDVNGSVLAQVVAISSVDTSSGTYPVGSMFMRINGSDTSMWIKIRNTGSLAARWKKVTLSP